MVEKLICRIRRFDGESTWIQEYELPYEQGRTVLWALTKIREEQDRTLNFTSACRSAICGSCGVKVNGKTFLACKTPLDQLLQTFENNELNFEPMDHFEVIRDLVIDWAPMEEKMKKVKPWLIPNEQGTAEKGFKQSEEAFNRISAATDCILCGICASECEQISLNQDGYLEPFILNKAYRYMADSRTADPQAHLTPALENGLWKCLHCNNCVSSCPKEIPLNEHVAALRQESMKQGYTDNLGARHAYVFYNDVRNKGRLNEVTLPMNTEGILSTIKKRVPFALRMIRRGKINPLHMPREIPGIEGVRKLYELANEEGR